MTAMPPIVDRTQLGRPPEDGGATFERGMFAFPGASGHLPVAPGEEGADSGCVQPDGALGLAQGGLQGGRRQPQQHEVEGDHR
jgi:hypothetical protein